VSGCKTLASAHYNHLSSHAHVRHNGHAVVQAHQKRLPFSVDFYKLSPQNMSLFAAVTFCAQNLKLNNFRVQDSPL
jgi:hypothetical protein